MNAICTSPLTSGNLVDVAEFVRRHFINSDERISLDYRLESGSFEEQHRGIVLTDVKVSGTIVLEFYGMDGLTSYLAVGSDAAVLYEPRYESYPGHVAGTAFTFKWPSSKEHLPNFVRLVRPLQAEAVEADNE